MYQMYETPPDPLRRPGCVLKQETFCEIVAWNPYQEFPVLEVLDKKRTWVALRSTKSFLCIQRLTQQWPWPQLVPIPLLDADIFPTEEAEKTQF